MSAWEHGTRTVGRSLGSDLRRVLAIGDPRRTLYRDAHYFAATVEVDPDAMRPWLPAGVRLTAPARADLFTACFPDCTYLDAPYHEAGLFVHVKTTFGTGIHCPWMIVDDDVALILGRELLGYPKKLGQIDWTLDGDTIHAHATRRQTSLVTMHGTLGEALPDAPKILGRPHRNAAGGLGLTLPRLLAFTPGEHPIEVRRVEDFELEIGGCERDPIDQMGLGRVLDARLHRVDLTAGTPPVPFLPLNPLFLASRLRPRVL
jgi:acetoacetate decarboxylase